MSQQITSRTSGTVAFLVGLICWHWSASCWSEEIGMDMTIDAHIVENTCQVSIPGDGNVHLSMVGKSWFYNDDGTSRLQPTDAASGTLFAVKIGGCSDTTGAVKTLNFSFQPQSQQWPEQSRQVFINETSVAEGGASNTGVVIFSKDLNTNVLNSDGTSEVKLNAPTEWATEYEFYARLQNTGAVSAGKVTSSVLVNATYE